MFRYILRRLIQLIPVLIGISTLVFLFLYLIPGDPAAALLGERATPENIAQLRQNLGLDRPLFINLPYDYSYECADGYKGTVIDLALFTIPSCKRTVTYKENWALIRFRETSSVDAQRVINPGQPNEKKEVVDQEKLLRLLEKTSLDQLGLVPGEPKTFDLYNGKVTVTLNISRTLFSDPLDSQYFAYLGRLVRGDLGRSTQGNIPVIQELQARFPATIELGLAALFIAVFIGVPIGMLSALYRDTWLDTLSMLGALAGVSLPVFVLGLIGIYIFSVQLGWLPTGQRLDTGMTVQPITGLLLIDTILRGNLEAFGIAFKHLILPAAVLSTIPLSIIARITRSSMLEVLNKDYVRTARAKGLRERVVVIRHSLRNAMLPIVTMIGLQLGTLLSGAVLTETIFSWQGIGRWIYEAISARDYPTIQAATLLIALVYVFINLGVDLVYALFDPRIRYS